MLWVNKKNMSQKKQINKKKPTASRPNLSYGNYYLSMSNPHNKTAKKKTHKGRNLLIFLFFVVVVVGLVLGYNHAKAKPTPAKVSQTNATTKVAAKSTPPTVDQCTGNTLDKLILVSISARHLWACDGATIEYSSPVITGMEFLPADLTPVGTYHIYAKLSDTNIIGCDSTGCWNDHVNYYMKFLLNQYGTYGIHDAPWRTAADFGSISPNSPNASHGCVETPTPTGVWLYNWSPIGTTVTVVA